MLRLKLIVIRIPGNSPFIGRMLLNGFKIYFKILDLLNSMHIYPEKQSQILPDGTSIHYTTEPWMSTNLWGYWVSVFFLLVPLIISDSTWRIFAPQTMVVSLQYCLEYCTALISPNCHPLEVSKGGLFLHVPYLCPTVSAMAGDVAESA